MESDLPSTAEYPADQDDLEALYSAYAADEPEVTPESLWRIPGPFGTAQHHFHCDIMDG